MSRTKAQIKQSENDVDEIEDISSDLDYLFSDINSELSQFTEKVQALEDRIENIDNPEAVEAFREFKNGFENLLYADMEYGDISDELENQIDDLREDEEND